MPGSGVVTGVNIWPGSHSASACHGNPITCFARCSQEQPTPLPAAASPAPNAASPVSFRKGLDFPGRSVCSQCSRQACRLECAALCHFLHTGMHGQRTVRAHRLCFWPLVSFVFGHLCRSCPAGHLELGWLCQ